MIERENPCAAARGCCLGVLIGGAIWLLVALVVL